VRSDLLASEDLDLLAEFNVSFLTLGSSRLQLFLGALSSTRDSRVAQLQDCLDVLWPAKHCRVQLDIFRCNVVCTSTKPLIIHIEKLVLCVGAFLSANVYVQITTF